MNEIKQPNNSKYVYAPYLTMAACNIDAVFYHLEDIFNHKQNNAIEIDDGITQLYKLKIFQDLGISNGSNDENTPVDFLRKDAIIKQICRNIPFFNILFDSKIFSNKSLDERCRCVDRYIRALFDMRNYYSHVLHEEIDITHQIPNIENDLNYIFEENRNTVKKRFVLNDDDIKHLKVFHKDKKGSNSYYKFLESGDHCDKLTVNGLLFFTCMFLEKRYAYELLKKHYGFKNSSSKMHKATLETFTVTCIRLPHNKLEVSDSKVTLGLDIANEICKCPDEIFSLLSIKDRNKFRIPIDKTDPEQNINEDCEDNDTQTILQKRYSNRFPYFALRYLEFMNHLPDIYFHIDMGTYFYDCYKKQLIDNSEIKDRRLSKNILCFDKMDNAVKTFNDSKNSGLYAARYDEKNEYRNNTFPHYHINNNQIGISLEKYIPELRGKDTRLRKPDALLSVYELPLIVYLCLNNKGEDVTELIKNHINTSKLFFEYVASGGRYSIDNENMIIFNAGNKINSHHLPELFRKDKLNYKDLASKALKNQREKAQNIIDRYYTTKDRKGKILKNKRSLKTGHIADILMEDLMRFQPSIEYTAGKDKVSSPNYQALQKAFAYMGSRYMEIPNLLRKARLTHSENSHPFIDKCISPMPKNINGFFKRYLEEKIKYIDTIVAKGDFTNAYFLRDYIKKYGADLETERRNAAHNLIDKPADIPRGIFKDLFSTEYASPTYHIYIELLENEDDVQDFYHLKLNFPEYINEKQKYKVYQKINFIRACDIVSFYMMKDLIGIDNSSVKLMSSGGDKHILNLSQNVDIPVMLLRTIGKGKNTKTKINEQIISGKIKIKDYGKFRRLIFDKRLFSYSLYFNKNEEGSEKDKLIFDDIEFEFTEYDKSRLKIFELIHKFEERVIIKNAIALPVPANSDDKKNKKYSYISFSDILKKSGLNKESMELLKNIRNAFSHHEYYVVKDLNANKREITKKLYDKCEKDIICITNSI